MSNKIIITENIITDARMKGLKINDILATEYEGVIADKIKENENLKSLTPLQMAMKDAGVTKNALVKDFFTTTDSKYLFPAIIDTRFAETIATNPMLQYVIGSEQTINGKAIQGLKIDFTNADNKAALNKKDVSEGAELPKVKIGTGDKAITLHKRGVAVETTYEAMMYSPVDMFMKCIDRIAGNQSVQQMGDVIEVLVNGDGNSNAATVDTVSGSTLTTADLVTFAINFFEATNGLTLDTIVCDKTQYKALVSMVTAITNDNTYKLGATFNFPQAMFSNITVISDSRVPKVSTKDILVGLNKSNAITKYIAAGSQINEIAKNISNQTSLGTLSEIVGFAKFDDNASRVLKLA